MTEIALPRLCVSRTLAMFVLVVLVSAANPLGMLGQAEPPTVPLSLPNSAQSIAQQNLAAGAGDYIIVFRPGTSQAGRANAALRAGALVRFNYTIVNAVAVTAPNANALAAMQRDASVLEIIPDRPVYALQEANGQIGVSGKPGGGGPKAEVVPAGVERVGIPNSTSGAGVGVAIVDTGIDFNHTDLAPSQSAWYSAFGGSCQDDNGHGTHVTGTVAALDNEFDVVGVAPRATPYCVKVLDASGSGSESGVMAGLNWVANNANTVNPKIRVVNMSLGRAGTLGDNPAFELAVRNLYNSGIVVVVSAGNDPYSEVSEMVPATYPEVFAVASTTAKDGTNSGCRTYSGLIYEDTASYFTTDGIGVTISAPGEDQENISKACRVSSVGILSTKLGGGTTRMSGTSMAAPHVSGIVARMMPEGGVVNASGVEGIRSALRANADRKNTVPLDSPTSGYSFDGELEGIALAPQ